MQVVVLYEWIVMEPEPGPEGRGAVHRLTCVEGVTSEAASSRIWSSSTTSYR